MASEEFDEAAERVKHMQHTPSNEDLLFLYAHFKQATVGPCNTSRPGTLDFKGKAKWGAWHNLGNMDKASTKAAYIAKVNQLAPK